MLILFILLSIWSAGYGYTRAQVTPAVELSGAKRWLGEVELYFTWPLIAYHLYKEGSLF